MSPISSTLKNNSLLVKEDENESNDSKYSSNPSLSNSIIKNVEINDEVDEQVEKNRNLWRVGPEMRGSYNIASFVNDSVLLQQFIKMGVEIHRWDKVPKTAEHILKMDFEKDVAPYIRFLCDNGVDPDNLSYQFSKSPQLLEQDLQNLQVRIDYLKAKKFTLEQIKRIINHNPNWLTHTTVDIDKRLGFFQSHFNLNGFEVRSVASKGPKIITLKEEQIKDVSFQFLDAMGFSPHQVKSLLLSHPYLWKLIPRTLWNRFDYLHNDVKFTHETLVSSPKLFLAREGRLRGRIGFLQSVARAQFNPQKPNYVSVDELIGGTDVEFATQVAKSSVAQFNKFIKLI